MVVSENSKIPKNPDQVSLVMRVLDRVFEKKVIVNCDKDPYLHRWYVLRTQRVGLFVHKFVRSDEDRALHDHPWSFIVIPLWGGYIEHSDRKFNLELVSDCEYLPDDFLHCPVGTPYTERIEIKRRIWPLISTRYRNTEYRHRVELINARPSWSIFFRFTKIREWGFWPKSGFIQWNRWWQENKCE